MVKKLTFWETHQCITSNMWQCLMQLLILRSHNYIVYELSSNGVELLCLTLIKKKVLLTKYVIYRYPQLHTYM